MKFLTGEPLALDLVNSRVCTPTGEVDALDSADGFHAWLAAQAGRLDLPATALTSADLSAVRALRAHVADAVDSARAGRAPAREVLEALNHALRSAPSHTVLTWDGAALVAGVQRVGSARSRLLVQLAEAAAELLTDPRARTIRACEGPQCRMLFLPAHPRRRWCSPAVCGNRVRVARYYQRRHT